MLLEGLSTIRSLLYPCTYQPLDGKSALTGSSYLGLVEGCPPNFCTWDHNVGFSLWSLRGYLDFCPSTVLTSSAGCFPASTSQTPTLAPSVYRLLGFLTAFSLALSSWGDSHTPDTDHTPGCQSLSLRPAGYLS